MSGKRGARTSQRKKKYTTARCRFRDLHAALCRGPERGESRALLTKKKEENLNKRKSAEHNQLFEANCSKEKLLGDEVALSEG